MVIGATMATINIVEILLFPVQQIHHVFSSQNDSIGRKIEQRLPGVGGGGRGGVGVVLLGGVVAGGGTEFVGVCS